MCPHCLSAALGQHIGQGVVLEHMVVIDGCRRIQGDQGIAYVGQRFVKILYRPLQSIIRREQGGQLTSEEGDGLAACAEEQPTQQRSKDEKAV